MAKSKSDIRVLKQAIKWWLQLRDNDNKAAVLAGVNAWLGESPRHRKTWQDLQRTLRLSKLMLIYWKSGSTKDSDAFFEALDEERCRSQKEFADA